MEDQFYGQLTYDRDLWSRKNLRSRETVENGVNALNLQPCISPLLSCCEGKLDLQAYLVNALKF